MFFNVYYLQINVLNIYGADSGCSRSAQRYH